MNRRVLVTGAGSGLGLALARRLVDDGNQVVATDLAETAADLPGAPDLSGMGYAPLDVRSDHDWWAVRDLVAEQWGGLDLLVNNAGVAGGGRIDRSGMDEWQRLTDINLLGVARGCHTFAGMMKRQGSGQIVNVASIAGLVHPPGMASYNAVKAGVVALSETLRHELAPYGVSTSVVCPSFFRTNLAASMQGADTDVQEKAAQLIEKSDLTAEEIADAVVAAADRGEFLILPDVVARASYQLRLDDPDAYAGQMQVTAQRAMEREQEAQRSATGQVSAR